MYAIAIFVNDNDIMHICIWGSFTFYVAERSWKGKTHAFLIYLYIWKSQEFISREFRAAFKKILCKFFCQTKWNQEQWKVLHHPQVDSEVGCDNVTLCHTVSHCVSLCHTVSHCDMDEDFRRSWCIEVNQHRGRWCVIWKRLKKRNLSFLPKVPSLHFCTFLFLLLCIFT